MSQNKYDILRSTWIYQEIQQEVQEYQQQCHLNDQRDLLYEIVQARFPRLAARIQQSANQAEDLQNVRRLLVIISTARNEKEARQWLSTGAATD